MHLRVGIFVNFIKKLLHMVLFQFYGAAAAEKKQSKWLLGRSSPTHYKECRLVDSQDRQPQKGKVLKNKEKDVALVT